MTSRGEGPKRSVLAQERSRETRRAIVRAALELWQERGYESGFDDTKAEDIAARAGVAKTTFYFHFARKDDILFEAGWLTASIFYEEALNALASGRTVDVIIDQLLAGLSNRVEKGPRIALRRMLQAQSQALDPRITITDPVTDREHFGIQRAFAVIFTHGQEMGEIPRTIGPRVLAEMLASLVMDALRDWAIHDGVDLRQSFEQRAAVLLAGARHVELAPAGRADAALASPRKSRTGSSTRTG
jgi:AcrR family transcriptional regulator